MSGEKTNDNVTAASVGSDSVVVLRVESAEALVAKWGWRAVDLNEVRNRLLEKGEWTAAHAYKVQADAYDECAGDLRRQIAAASVRQPQHNVRHEPRGANHS